MAYRRQFCPVCQTQTKHKYTSTSLVLFLILLCLGVVPGLLYLWIAFRRADRTATCTVNHGAAQNAQMIQLVAALEAARNGGVTVEIPTPAPAANEKRFKFPKWLV